MYHVCARYPWKPEEEVGVPETEVSDDCELSFGC